MVNAEIEERYLLVKERIEGILQEDTVNSKYKEYFYSVAKYILYNLEVFEKLQNGDCLNMTIEELQDINDRIFEDIKVENYENSVGNPDYMERISAGDEGAYLLYLYGRIKSLTEYVYKNKKCEITIVLELFAQVYNIFEEEEINIENLREAVYYFVYDYADVFVYNRVKEITDEEESFYVDIIKDSDLEDLRYLYKYGRYISDNELGIAKFLNSLSQEKIDSIARTYTEGYRKGFIAGKKDMSIKDRVSVGYAIGFERVAKAAMKQFEAMGLKTIIRTIAVSSTPLNKQYSFDHKFDLAVYFDKAISDRELGVMKSAFEDFKDKEKLFAGPAYIETFGENPFEPVIKKSAVKLNDKQQKLMTSHNLSFRTLYETYINSEETSFTIIAYPIPEIGKNFVEIFEDTIKINNLDDELYKNIQERIIAALDKGDYVTIKGRDDNKTDLKVKLWDLKNPEKETLFENCVADVNIPVGEVFTSPRLKGTEGVLNVSKAYLNELKFTDLTLEFKDGMIVDYSCSNFEDKDECKRFIKENLLRNHDSLPMGEFAIGTNTTAYRVAEKYDILYKLPILIVEKMGPHFAIGDTCYSHEEDVMTYNPDGRAIIARENECSALRHEDINKAYFSCHTDITIPYEQLQEIVVVTGNGDKIKIIENCRFVLPGTEELNKPLDKNNID